MKDVINIGSRRELLWDDVLVDTKESTTEFRLHQPVQRDCTTFTQPWAQGASPYMCVLQDGDIYRMYNPLSGGLVYSESRDGIHWEQPNLGLVEYEGSRDNSLVSFVMEPGSEPRARGFDGFRAFIDENPNCPPEERYKAVANEHEHLQCFVSADGLQFKHVGQLTIPTVNPGSPFDSTNTVFFDKNTGKYRCYVRDYYNPSNAGTGGLWIRAISTSESAELFPTHGWPKTKFLRYDTPNAWQMYINSIMPYYRAEHFYIGFPSRYVIREKWTENYDELCGMEDRLRRAGASKSDRGGLSISDTLFMTSRDGLNWTRYPDAFVRPGPEHPTNWIYGSVYFSNGIVETKSEHPGCDNEISFYCMENRFFKENPKVYRYTIRMDGFVSQSAPYPEANLYTKPFIFEGKDMFINFSTSAYGYMRFNIKDEDGNSISSCETFGDSTDRRVRFNGDLSAFAGKPVTMSVNMFDADFYSFIFR